MYAAAPHVSAFSLLGLVALVIIATVAGLWAWTTVLDRYEHDPGRVRAFLFSILAISTAFDTGLYCRGVTYSSVLCMSLLANAWGGVDAVLRFPAVHKLESFFGLKQIGLLLAKTLAYIIGVTSFRRHAVLLLVAIFVNTWGLMLLYFMAYPMDMNECVIKHDEYDVDLALRLWKLASVRHERQRCLSLWRRWWYQGVSASKGSGLARLCIRFADPHFQQTLYKVRHV
jgi:hypothetical protein